jgi:hypothetical protein
MMMSFARVGALSVASAILAAAPMIAQDLGTDFTRYRAFQLGSSVSAVATAAAIPVTEATLLHERPARLQDLTWRLSRWIGGSPATDPVNQMRFSFYNDQLFRIVVEYAADKTEGMTDADLIDALASSYGRPLVRRIGTTAALPGPDLEGGTAVAHWGDAAHMMVVYRAASYGAPMRLVLTDVRVEELARRARLESQRLDEQDAPRREIARQKQERDDSASATEKAREANKATFRP